MSLVVPSTRSAGPYLPESARFRSSRSILGLRMSSTGRPSTSPQSAPRCRRAHSTTPRTAFQASTGIDHASLGFNSPLTVSIVDALLINLLALRRRHPLPPARLPLSVASADEDRRLCVAWALACTSSCRGAAASIASSLTYRRRATAPSRRAGALRDLLPHRLAQAGVTAGVGTSTPHGSALGITASCTLNAGRLPHGHPHEPARVGRRGRGGFFLVGLSFCSALARSTSASCSAPPRSAPASPVRTVLGLLSPNRGSSSRSAWC